MSPNGSGAGTELNRLSGYIESRVVAAASEHPFSLDAADLPEWRHQPSAGPLHQWYIGELFDLCSKTGVDLSRCSTVHGPLHLSKDFNLDGARAELRSSFPYSGYLGVHQIRVREGDRWPFLSVETAVTKPGFPSSAADLFEAGQGRVDAAMKFADIDYHSLSGELIGGILRGLDPSLQAGRLPETLRISCISNAIGEARGGLVSFEWTFSGGSGTVESVVMAAPEGRLLRRGGVIHVEELPQCKPHELVAGVIDTVLAGDVDEILSLPLSIHRPR